MTPFNPCFLIPCYNHGRTVPAVIDALSLHGFHIVVVDDGSDAETKEILQEVALRTDVSVVTLAENGGKGAAVIAGIRKAHELGCSHAIQVDADGQHDFNSLPELIAESKAHPTTLISGRPVYDESVPKKRLYGRYITHVWVWIETLSLTIKDSMCGFRSYPVEQAIAVLDKGKIGQRMDFDTEIMVRMYWAGGDVRFVDTRIIYPEDGISHFDVFADNVRISGMHTRLFFGMLPRIPKLLFRTFRNPTHWSRQKERGTIFGMKFSLAVYALLGRGVFNQLLKLIIGYYYLTGASARNHSKAYLKQLQEYASKQNKELPTPLNSYRHLMSFGTAMLDKLAAWRGDMSLDNLTLHGVEPCRELIDNKQGVVLIGSHLGNLELCRALSHTYPGLKINALVFSEHAVRFNAVMHSVNPDANLNLIHVTNLGPEVGMQLQEKIDAGEWVVIVGDRTSVTKEKRVVWADFLGKPAPFPQGPFMLAYVLKAPVFLMFGLRKPASKKPHFDIYVEQFSDQIKLPRKGREEALCDVVQQYATRLEYYAMKAPLEWYNFFNFWQLSGKNNDEK